MSDQRIMVLVRHHGVYQPVGKASTAEEACRLIEEEIYDDGERLFKIFDVQPDALKAGTYKLGEESGPAAVLEVK